MSNRYQYDTLNISLQTESPNRNPSKLVKTLDYDAHSQQEQEADNDQKVKLFRQLYYKNQKLRRQLKALNEKLNERLQKVKLPNVKNSNSIHRRKALSVDLNQPVKPPNKAQIRQLENAYRQVKMYKQQIEVLKIKEDTPGSYQKVRAMENAVTYRDKQIAEVQEQLKSIKNVKKMQQKKIVSELQNEDVIDRISQYESQLKNLRERQKQIANKARKRQQDYKKQQAYQIALEKKLRNDKAQQLQEEVIKPEQRRQITEMEWNIVKQEMNSQKASKDQMLTKIQKMKNSLKATKDQQNMENQKFKEKENQYRNLLIKLESLRTLIRQQDRVERQMEKQKQKEKQKARIQEMQKLRKKMEQQGNSSQDDSILTPKEESKRQSTAQKGQREWKGKTRKVQHGFMAPTDERFQILGKLKGLKVFLDQNQFICGMTAVIQGEPNSDTVEKQIIGNQTNIQLKWQAPQNDDIKKIVGSFSQQGYLAEINLVSKNGMSAKFGSNSSADVFKFILDTDQYFEGIFGSLRKLNKDIRITELGFWVTKQSKINGKTKVNESLNIDNGQSRAMISSHKPSENISL